MTFDVQENRVDLGLIKDCEFSPPTFSCCGYEAIAPKEHVNLLVVCSNDPPSFDYDLFEGQRLDSMKAEPL